MFPADAIVEMSAMRETLRVRLAAIDPGRLAAGHAQALVDEAEQLARLAVWAKARFAAAAVDETWKVEGFRSPSDWLAARTGTSKSQAASELTLSGQLAELPQVDAALSGGVLSVPAAKAIADAAAVAPHEEERLVELGCSGTIREIAEECERVRHAADPDPDAKRERIRRQRSYRCWVKDGVGHIHLSGPADEIARVDAKIRDTAGRRFRATRAAKTESEPIEAHRYDAAVDAVLADSDGVPVPKGADAKIIVGIDLPALCRGHALDGERCEIAGIGPVPVSVVREWFDNAFIAAVLTDGVDVSKVVHLGRKFKAHQVTALQWKGPQCVVTGCTNTHGLQLDHDTGWAITHTTEVNDAQQMCPACHRKKTAGWHLHPPDERGKRELVPPHHPSHPNQELRQALADAAHHLHQLQHGDAA